jgi:hypothetical protein
MATGTPPSTPSTPEPSAPTLFHPPIGLHQPNANQDATSNVENASTSNVHSEKRKNLKKEANKEDTEDTGDTEPPKPSYPRVSEFEFWQKGPPGYFDTGFDDGPGTFLSYSMFLFLTVVGGFLALDHLYLRSPLTALAKIAVNLMAFGIWWIYDAVQAVFNDKVVRLYGLGIPVLGPKGIGAGIMAKDEPDVKHMRFFWYALAVIGGGLFGMDSFLVGNTRTGLMRLVGVITMIGIPVSACVWFYEMYRFFCDTEHVVGEFPDYFGSKGSRSSIFDWFNPASWLTSIMKALSVTPAVRLKEIYGTIQGEKGKENIKKAVTRRPVPGQAGGNMETMEPLTEGGDSSSILSYTLISTIVFIIAAGFAATFSRARKHVPSYDDTPPEPGVPGEPSKERRAA